LETAALATPIDNVASKAIRKGILIDLFIRKAMKEGIYCEIKQRRTLSR
jgi:hypothetical protein